LFKHCFQLTEYNAIPKFQERLALTVRRAIGPGEKYHNVSLRTLTTPCRRWL